MKRKLEFNNEKGCNFHIYLSCHEESACCDIDEIVLTTKITSDISKDIKIKKQTIEVHSLDELKNILNKIEKGEKI